LSLRSYLNESARKASKSKNSKGNPVRLPSKILAVAPDPEDVGQVYVAEAAGNLKRIRLEVGQRTAPPNTAMNVISKHLLIFLTVAGWQYLCILHRSHCASYLRRYLLSIDNGLCGVLG